MSKRGKLIVIDGSDSSGKNTQTKLLASCLRKEGFKVKSMSFPVYDSFFGKLVSDYLNGKFGKLNDVDPKLASTLYALDRYGQKDKLEKWLSDGNMVVLDRYVESNIAYNFAKLSSGREKFLKWLEDLEFKQLGVPKSDLVVYLDVPLKVSEKLIKGRKDKGYLNGKKRDIHEASLPYRRKVESAYKVLAKKKKWKVISCVDKDKIKTKKEISDLVFSIVKKFTKK